jgi:hypothetical protein
VPLNSEARQFLLDVYKETSDEEFVFVNPKTGLNLTDVKKGFNSACREAGIIA